MQKIEFMIFILLFYYILGSKIKIIIHSDSTTLELSDSPIIFQKQITSFVFIIITININ